MKASVAQQRSKHLSKALAMALAAPLLSKADSEGFVPATQGLRMNCRSLHGAARALPAQKPAVERSESSRRDVAAWLAAAAAWTLGKAYPARAIELPAAPSDFGWLPPKKVKLTCKTEVECALEGEAAEKAKFGPADGKFSQTPSGVRFKDMKEGNPTDGVAQLGSTVQLRFKVMRSGKRSYDGLSGEASTIFSKGFGLDDGPKDGKLVEKLGDGKFVKSLEEGLVGMSVGSVRRVQVRPEKGLGWRKPGKCGTGFAAVGAISGIPGASIESNDSCLMADLLPQPADFQEKRRFLRRFDESLIVELELLGLGSV